MAATKSRLTWRQASSVISRRQYGEQDMSALVRPRSTRRWRRISRISSASPWTNACTRPRGNDELLQRGGQEVAVLGRAGAVQPLEVEGPGAGQLELVVGAVADDPDHGQGSRRHGLEGGGDRREGGLVSDHQVPVGLGVGAVAAARTLEDQDVSRPDGGRPRTGDTRVAVDDEVDGQLPRRGVPGPDRVAAARRPGGPGGAGRARPSGRRPVRTAHPGEGAPRSRRRPWRRASRTGPGHHHRARPGPGPGSAAG